MNNKEKTFTGKGELVKLTTEEKAKLYNAYIDYLLTLTPNNRYQEMEMLKEAIKLHEMNWEVQGIYVERHYDLFFQNWAYANGVKIKDL